MKKWLIVLLIILGIIILCWAVYYFLGNSLSYSPLVLTEKRINTRLATGDVVCVCKCSDGEREESMTFFPYGDESCESYTGGTCLLSDWETSGRIGKAVSCVGRPFA